MPGPVESLRAGAPLRPSARAAESALRRLGFSRVPVEGRSEDRTDFWVESPGAPRRRYAVFVEDARGSGAPRRPEGRPAILVVPDEERARVVWQEIRAPGTPPRIDPDVSILVVPSPRAGAGEPHWHAGAIDRRQLPMLATGIVVGLFRRATGSGGAVQIDFEEMIRILRSRFHIDLVATLGTVSTEDSLWVMYQLALRYSYAPGDSSSNLHLLVLKPTGPAARLPWFAA
ncbi:MAG: hypothetical protein ACREC5_05260 [Thermoplasmata archaeon]